MIYKHTYIHNYYEKKNNVQKCIGGDIILIEIRKKIQQKQFLL